ncbi:MAG: hypothetical protein ABR592_09145 [Nitriliruptorales bacterium]
MDDQLRSLYAAPLEEFVAERDALARTLRERGEREAAAAVKALRKPTVTAWALNQLSRRQPRKLGRLLEAADRLGQAQSEAISGAASPGKLREAITEYREALEDVSREASDILEGAGTSPPARMPEVLASLQAATVDEEARRQLREGTLTRPFASTGLAGLEPGLVAAPRSPPRGDPQPVPQEARQGALATARRAEARERERRARKQLGSLLQEADQLKRAAESARKRAERLASEAEVADRQAREAEQRAEEATEAVRRAREELEAAERAMKETERLASLAHDDRPSG